jgi:hypothetical protein
MTDDKERLQAQQAQENQHRRCPACKAFPRLTLKFLNPQSGRTVQLYECECGERVWDD